MKTKICLAINVLFQIVLCHKNNSLASHAIADILNRFFAKFAPKVDLLNYGLNENDNLVRKILQIKSDLISIQVINNAVTNVINSSSIVLFDSKKNFEKIVSEITWQSNPSMRNNHIVHYPNATIADISKAFNNGFDVDNVIFLVNECEESIDLATSFMFSPENCRSNQFKIINRFNKSNMRWDNSNFYPDKYTNLHGCVLKVAAINTPSVTKLKILSNGSVELEGYNYDVIVALAKTANFKIEINIFDSLEDALSKSTIDLIAYCEHILNSELVLSTSFLFGGIVLFIPPGELYTPLEKMFLIFHYEVWISIAVTFMVTMGTVQIINRASFETRKFIFGQNINTPTLNIFSNFLIGNQTVLPTTNFARFLLMLFIIWSLIIRTCHQSMLFKYLQQDLRKPEVKTIQELFEQDFTFYGAPETAADISKILDEEFPNK